MTEHTQPTKELKDIKEGDTVYVAWNSKYIDNGYNPVCKVGRVYGFVEHRKVRFNLTTGIGDSYGIKCKVYLSEEEYEKDRISSKERDRLKTRLDDLCRTWDYRLYKNSISDSFASSLHALLDKHEQM